MNSASSLDVLQPTQRSNTLRAWFLHAPCDAPWRNSRCSILFHEKKPSIDVACLQTACSRVRQGWTCGPRQSFARWGRAPQGPSKSAFGDPNCELFPQGPIIPVPPSTPPYRLVGICGNNRAVSPGRHAKRKPPNQRVRRPLSPLFRWWLCSMATPKQHQAVLGSTKMRAQKPVPAIPTR